MKRKNHKSFFGLLILSLAVSLLPVGGVCAEEKSCTVSIPAETLVSGKTAPDGTEFELVLEPLGADCPMPSKAEIVGKGSGKVSFGPIVYTVPEDYQYRIYQKEGNAENFIYDKTVYTVTVRIVNTDDGGLEAQIWAVKDGAEDKTGRILFTNLYQPPETSVVKTGDTASADSYILLLLCSAVIGISLLTRKMRRE